MEEIQNQIMHVQTDISTLNEGVSEEKIYTLLNIAGDTYALDTKCVLEILKSIELTHHEKLPLHIAGLFEYDGKIINVVDIKSILNIENGSYDIDSMIVILNVEGNVFGVLVNKVEDIKRIDESTLQDVPYNTEYNFIEKIYNNENVQYGVLNLSKINSWVLDNMEEAPDRSGCSLMPNDSKSLDILHKRKLEYIEKLQKIPYTTVGDKDEFVSFYAGENKYCLKMNEIKGFYKLQETKMIKVPCTPDFILGLVNIKGDFISVLDIKNYFHSQNTPYSGSGTIIVLNSDEFKIGILADAVSDNIEIKPEEIQNLKKQDAKGELLQYVKDAEIYLMISVGDLLADDKLFIR